MISQNKHFNTILVSYPLEFSIGLFRTTDSPKFDSAVSVFPALNSACLKVHLVVLSQFTLSYRRLRQTVKLGVFPTMKANYISISAVIIVTLLLKFTPDYLGNFLPF